MPKKILYLYTGDHYVHRGFADIITKKHIKSSWRIPRDYQIYFNEGEFFKPVILRIFGLINKKSKIISLFSDPRLFYYDKKIRFDLKKQKPKKYSVFKRFLFKFLLKKLDGAICIGNFQKDLLKKHFNGPIKVVYPFIEDKKYKKLRKISPSLEKENILFVTTWGDHYCKGLDFLIDLFDPLKKELSKVKLYILGKPEIQKNWIKKDLFFEGFKNIEDYLKKSSLTVHFGRGESFGLNILESLLAGVPVIVSKYTGAKEVIKKINPKFVVPLDKKIAIRTIKEYFNLNKTKKKKFSIISKKIALKFNKEKQVRHFKEKFRELLIEIQ